MTSSARQPVALQSPRLAPLMPPARPADPGASGRSPYSVREAAALLGVSPDEIEANHALLGGRRGGRRILIPRWAVDRLVCDPRDADGGGGRGQDKKPPLERVLALLPLLAPEERLRVAQVALAAAPA